MQPEPDHAKTIFLRAIEGQSPENWEVYLDGACGEDAPLRSRVARLLKAHQEMGSFREEAPAVARTIDMPAESSIAEKPGTVIGPYKLLQQIGEGGMGVVYMAEQAAPVRRKVALKIIKPGMDTREVIARFEAERQALALMDHPNIARVFDAGATEASRPYFVMELVRGVPITDYCDQNNLPVHERLELFITVCHAVQHAHQKGIIHRDIKPSNVLVTLHDSRPVPKVIDFGVAKAIGQQLTDKTLFTQFAQMVGTPLYMSPEQAELTGLDIDTRGDIYSLGVMLYELLTGTTPFERGRMKQAALDEIRRMIREDDPPSPSTRLSSTAGETQTAVAAHRRVDPKGLSRLVRGDLDWIVMKALEKDRNRRYETANGFAADIGRYLSDEPVEACPPSAAYRFRKFARRNRVAFSTVAVVSLALVLGTVVSAWQAIRATQAEGLAETRLAAETDARAKAVTAQTAAEQSRKDEVRHRTLAEKSQKDEAAQRAEAERQATIATANEELAKAQENLARHRFYAAQINLANQAWEMGHSTRVLELLESQRPKLHQADLRTFEWYYLWRLCHSGRQLSWRAHQGQMNAVAFSRDGAILASGGEDRNLKLWDAATGKVRATLKQGGVLSLAFSPDGKTLCAGSWSHWDRGLRLWDVATGQEQAALPGDVRDVTGLAFSPDGKTLAARVYNGTLVLWDMTARRIQRSLEAHTVGGSVAFSPDGKTLATASHWGDGLTKVWDLSADPPRVVHQMGAARSVAFSPDGKILATDCDLTTVILWDVASGQERARLSGHKGVVTSVAFSPDGKMLVSGSIDRSVKLWNVATGQELHSQAHLAPVLCVALGPDGTQLASGTADGTFKLWDMGTTREPVTLPHEGPVRSLRFTNDGATLISAGDCPTRFWDVASASEREILPVYFGTGVLSPDLKSLVSPSADGSMKLLDAATGEARAVLSKGTSGPWCGAFAPDGKTWVSGGGTTQLWDVATHKLRATLPVINLGPTSQLAFSPDGQTLALGSQWNMVRLWNVVEGRQLTNLGETGNSWIWAISFSNDGRTLAAGNDRGIVRLWDVETGQLRASLKGHTDTIRSIAFSPEGPTLATASDDGTVKLWDVITGQERLTLTGHTNAVISMAFSPNGKTLATGSLDGTMKLSRAAAEHEAFARKSELDPDDPDSPMANNNWAYRLKRAARFREAEAVYRQEIPRLENLTDDFPAVPDYPQELARSHLGLSFVLANTTRSEEAEREYSRAIDLLDRVGAGFPDASDSRAGLAYTYSGHLAPTFAVNRQPAEGISAYGVSIQLYETLIATDPLNSAFLELLAKANWFRAHLLNRTNRVNDARSHFQAAVAIFEKLALQFPADVSYRGILKEFSFGLAIHLAAAGHEHDAVVVYRKLLGLDPTNVVVLNNLAWLLTTGAEAGLRDPGSAVELARQATELAPKEGGNWNTLGVAQYRAGDWPAAIEALTKSVELRSGGDSFDWFFLAMAYWQSDNKDEARKWFDRAVTWMEKNQPQNEELRRFRTEAAELLGVKEDDKK